MRKTQSHKIAETTSSYEHHADELEAAPQILNGPKSHPTSSSSTEDLTKTPLYFTSEINEGIGNVEEVTEYDSKENTVNILTENETYIATKLPDNFLKVTDEENETLLPHGNIYDFGDLLSDHSENQSDSDSDFRLSFESSSNDDEFTLPVKIENITPSQNKGNLPFFERLDPACETNITPVPHPLRIKSMPTATVVRESPVSESYHFHTPVASDGRSFSTGEAGRDKRKPSISETNSATESYKEIGRDANYCSTNVQTKLFNKISKLTADAFDDIITHSRFPEIQFSMTSLIKKSKSPLKVHPFTKFDEEPKPFLKPLGDSYSKTFRKDLTADLENFESEVDKAFEESVSEGTFMPLLKQELQCTIQVRRLSRGQPELVLEPEEPKTYELTPEEIKKKEARLDQNRRSARKSRSKAKSYEKKLVKAIKHEMTEHARLSKELVNLRNEREKYRKMHDDHVKYCTRPYTH